MQIIPDPTTTPTPRRMTKGRPVVVERRSLRRRIADLWRSPLTLLPWGLVLVLLAHYVVTAVALHAG